MVKDKTGVETINRFLEARWQAQLAASASVLAQQDYYAAVQQAHESGLTWQRIGTELGVHFTRARALALKAQPQDRS